GAIIRVSIATGAQSPVSSGGQFSNPEDLTVIADGNYLVADASAFGGPGAVFRVDATTGAQAVVSSGGLFVSPFALVSHQPDIFVVDPDEFGMGLTGGAVIRVNSTTGAQSVLSSQGFFSQPIGIALGISGDLL